MTDELAPLAQHACRSECSWAPAGATRAGLPLFRCRACASEWIRTELWTPANADGVVAPEVRAQVALRPGRYERDA